MQEKGIIVGCDHKQEWLLPWWLKSYSRYNSYPIAFADFGMTLDAKNWCREKGLSIEIPKVRIAEELEISLDEKALWESQYGKGIWFARSGWFKKPLALLQSPFSKGLWLDLDCEVKGPLEPLFHSLSFGAEISLVKDPLQDSFEEINYNSGVIAFSQNAPILHFWIKEALENSKSYIGDQPALNRAISLHKPSLIELPDIYNWGRTLGPNPNALIFHFTGGTGKIDLLKQIDPSLLYFLKKTLSD